MSVPNPAEQTSASTLNGGIIGTDAAQPGVAFSWPNGLLILTIILGCYLLVSNDTTGLPRYIQIIQALGHCVWLMPFALFYNVEATPVARKLYVGANLLFLVLIFALSA
jgi:hypothetical protein